jgi:hypothetical protein
MVSVCCVLYLQLSQFIDVDLLQLVFSVFVQPVLCGLQLGGEGIPVLGLQGNINHKQ